MAAVRLDQSLVTVLLAIGFCCAIAMLATWFWSWLLCSVLQSAMAAPVVQYVTVYDDPSRYGGDTIPGSMSGVAPRPEIVAIYAPPSLYSAPPPIKRSRPKYVERWEAQTEKLSAAYKRELKRMTAKRRRL